MVPVEYKFKIVEDSFEINKNFKPLSKLPSLKLSFSIEGSKFIPDSSALRATQNFLWDIQYGVGEVWYLHFLFPLFKKIKIVCTTALFYLT